MNRHLIPLLALYVACALSAAKSQDSKPKGAHPAPPPTAAAASKVDAPDPTVSDGDKYHVLLENEQIRVLRYHDEPGAKTHPHHHPHAFAMFAFAPFRRALTFADGTRRERVFKAEEIAWMPAQTHTGENIGTTATDGLIIEVKSCAAAATQDSKTRPPR